MRKCNRIVPIILLLLLLTGCGTDLVENKKAGQGGDASKGTVFYLNFKPEAKEVWYEAAKDFMQETGIDVKIVTAANGTYENVLQQYLANGEMPTLFQINGKSGADRWSKYEADLSDTSLYDLLSDKSMAIESNHVIQAVPYTVEGYGIIYNEEIMNRYFALKNRNTSIRSAKEIKSFRLLQDVVDDMTKHKDDLKIKGVFAATSMKAGEQWRWHTHLANVPIYYEYQMKHVSKLEKISFSYGENMKQLFDLYLNHSTTTGEKLESVTVQSSMEEFARGDCAMVQNGNWAWSEISNCKQNVVKDDMVHYLPLFMGMPGESERGLCVGTENYWCVNSFASKDDQAATLKFIDWLINTPKGKEYAVKKLEFIMPFYSFGENEKPSNPLAREVLASLENTHTESIPWVFDTFPSETFKDDFGENLSFYAEGKIEWNELKKDVVKSWYLQSQLQ